MIAGGLQERGRATRDRVTDREDVAILLGFRAAGA